MDHETARACVQEITGLPCMIYMPGGLPCRYQFWSWDGTWKSELGTCLETLVNDIEVTFRKGRPTDG